MVTPHARRSLTRRTLLMISRPMESKTRTFQIGSPSSFNTGVLWVTRPPDPESWPSSVGRGSWFKLSSFWIEAETKVSHWQLVPRRKVSPVSHTDLSVSEGHWMRHGRPGTRVEESQPEREYVVVGARGVIETSQLQLPYCSSFKVSVSLICHHVQVAEGEPRAA